MSDREKTSEKTAEKVSEETPKKTKWKPLKLKKNDIVIAVVAVVLLALVGGGYYGATKTDAGRKFFKLTNITPVAAKARIEDFVKTSLVPPGTDLTVSDATEENGLYKAIVTVQKQDHVVYLTLDGSKLFPIAPLDTEVAKPAAAATATPTPQDVPKTAKPEVKLFVMSYCPYGTQIEKGILPVLATLGNKINFNLEFVSYSMHNNKATGDRKELDENLRQYCIRTQDPTKLNTYLGCFLKKGQGTEAACLATAGVDAPKNAACVTQSDTKFDVTKDFNDESTYNGNFPPFNADKADNDKYAVQGSPTLVINGVTADSQRDPESLLKIICSAFDKAPAECTKTLATAAPSAGFGEGTAAAGSASNGAACGN